ncbi:MAG: lipopolysaccharide transport system permease protein [Bacteroidetes bacterium]|nr:MAG: lipopolysaccharide transport system permease protein [Bacteroidota bacterium]
MSEVQKPDDTSWDLVIGGREKLFRPEISEIWKYRDLIILLVKRDFVAQYKQTVLGPLWHVLQPLVQTLLYSIFFAGILDVSTEGKPRMLYYLSGIVIWNVFSINLTATASTFTANAGIFGKVYFPRLVIPLSVLVSNFFKFLIQLVLFLGFLAWYLIFTDKDIQPNLILLVIPLLLIITSMMSLGIGLIVSSLTTRYRDIGLFLPFITQVLIYFTPVMLPVSTWGEEWSWVPRWNPMTPIVETFRYGFLGGTGPQTAIDWTGLLYAAAVALVLFFAGTIVFKRKEKDFLDTV